MNKKETYKFVALAYLLGFAVQLAFWKNPDQSFWLVLAMWTPALAVLLTGRYAIAEVSAAFRKIAIRSFGLSFFVGLLPYVVAQIFVYLSDLGRVDASQDLHRLPLVLFLNPVVTGLLGALGEEIGWRGFLQPELQKKFGATTSIFFVGLIWAYWHLPANLGGHNGVEHRVLNTFVIFPVTVIAMSFAFGWLRIRSESIWPCVYLHGVINSVSNYWIIKPDVELTEKIVGMVAWIFIALFFYFQLQKVPSASAVNKRLDKPKAHL